MIIALNCSKFKIAFFVFILWNPARAEHAAMPGMKLIPGGEFTMGSDAPDAWPEERPAHRVKIKEFYLDTTEVTNQRFAQFIKATGYITVAERKPDLSQVLQGRKPEELGVPPEMFMPGGMVFKSPPKKVDLRDQTQWWSWVPGAQWRHPQGPNSSIEGLDNHPVVQVAWTDADAFCRWAGGRLPTEAEWERAARGGIEGDGFLPDNGQTPIQANTWQGEFPTHDHAKDGHNGTAPVGSFEPNPYGLFDIIGNVWEWTADWYDPAAFKGLNKTEVSDDPKGPLKPQDIESKRTLKGGSFLCDGGYCNRARGSARIGAPFDVGTSHEGIRCARSL